MKMDGISIRRNEGYAKDHKYREGTGKHLNDRRVSEPKEIDGGDTSNRNSQDREGCARSPDCMGLACPLRRGSLPISV